MDNGGGNGRMNESPAVVVYEIRIQGTLDQQGARRFDGFAVHYPADGVTALVGPVADQAALHGLLSRIRDLAMPLIAVWRLDADDTQDKERS